MKKEGMTREQWIHPGRDMGEQCPVYVKTIMVEKKQLSEATIKLTALGVYQILVNGARISDAVLMPGWTSYGKRLQYQCYDMKPWLRDGENTIEITVGKGWYRSPMPGWISQEERARRSGIAPAVCAEIQLWKAGTDEGDEQEVEMLVTDSSWKVKKSPALFSEIYDGETYDARLEEEQEGAVSLGEVIPYSYCGGTLVPQQGEWIKEQERVSAQRIFQDHRGDTIIDFGQEVTGYVEFTVDAAAGDVVEFTHGEMLDSEGDFYRENYRGAKAEVRYTCKEGLQTWHPGYTYFGFRYLRLGQFPGEAKPEQFTAIAVYSDMRRTGTVETGNQMVNQLISNVFWGQRGNFLDVPTDCPQRDERLGWTGDAEVFIKTAAYNYDVNKFFTKWLADMRLDQRADGSIPYVIPDSTIASGSAAWDDAVTICPWQLYLTYGNQQILRDQFDAMKKYIAFITRTTMVPNLWVGGQHFGDWLGLDAEEGSYDGASRKDLIASAYYAISTEIVVKAGRVIGEDVSEYEILYQKIKKAFQETYGECRTQTEYVLALHFGLSRNPEEDAEKLVALIHSVGDKLQTGFVGTPYILHVLSEYGEQELAYKLLLRQEYPSWLYPITRGATTIWEHWDGMREDGSFWSTEMNSFNHYAYGSVLDWIYESAAGIKPIEEYPGFEKVRIEPHPNRALGFLKVKYESRYGRIQVAWHYVEDVVQYEIDTMVEAIVVIGGVERILQPGRYVLS